MKKSFTLIEILVVTTIIVLLTAVVVVSYSVFLKQSRDTKRKTDLEQIRAALEMFRSNNDIYFSFNGNCSSINLSETGLDDYISSMPSDPKSPFYYRCTISTSDYTLGARFELTDLPASSQCGYCSGFCNYCVGPYGQEYP